MRMRFCFFSGYEDLKGGYTTLLITLMKGLHQAGQETVLLNYKNGLIERELKKEGIIIHTIDLRELNSRSVADLLYPTDILIISKFHEYFNILLKVNPKVIYYDINDFIGQISDYKFGIKLPLLSKKLISKLLDKNGLLFMDDTGVGNIRSAFGIRIDNPYFLPIPIEVNESENRFLKEANNISDIINITYIGRSVKWKLTILEKIIGDCQNLNQAFKFHILVDNKSELGKILSLEKFSNKNLSIKIYENLPPSQVDEFLMINSDLHFGMGTTALHSAILGIPTILIDSSENKFPDNYTYSWLYESENFCLGRFIEKRGFKSGMSMKEIIDLVRNSESYRTISDRTFQYVTSNHQSNRIVEKLIAFSERSSFRLQDARWLVPYYFKAHQHVKKISKFISAST